MKKAQSAFFLRRWWNVDVVPHATLQDPFEGRRFRRASERRRGCLVRGGFAYPPDETLEVARRRDGHQQPAGPGARILERVEGVLRQENERP